MKFLYPVILCLVTTMCHAANSTPQDPPAPDFTQATEILESAIKDGAFPGCTAVVGTDQSILWSNGFGHFDYTRKTRVTTTTIYDLASLTKVTGTTVTLMRLAAKGKLDVSAPVSAYVPEFLNTVSDEENANRRKITVEHLLTHRSGLASWKPFYKSVEGYPNLIDALLATPLETGPGTKYRYSDLNFILLGEIAARAGEKLLPDLEQELVFQPLGMKSTLRNPSSDLIARIPPTERWPDRHGFVHGVVHDENARAGDGITGHAGLFSTAEDLALLARELLQGLEGNSALFPKETVEQFAGRQSETFNRGLGWGLSSGRGSSGTLFSNSSFGHTGFTGTSIWIDPERKLYVILLTNRVHPTRDNGKVGRVRGQLADAVARAFDEANP